MAVAATMTVDQSSAMAMVVMATAACDGAELTTDDMGPVHETNRHTTLPICQSVHDVVGVVPLRITIVMVHGVVNVAKHLLVPPCIGNSRGIRRDANSTSTDAGTAVTSTSTAMIIHHQSHISSSGSISDITTAPSTPPPITTEC